MINFEVRIFNLQFNFKINVIDNPEITPIIFNKTFLEISISHYHRFFKFGFNLGKYSGFGLHNAEIYLDIYYGNQHILKSSKNKRIILKNLNDG